MLTCVIVDDEFSAVEILKDYIAGNTELKLIKTYQDPSIAQRDLSILKKPLGIIFLDIEMPIMDGIELAKSINNNVKKIIFTTGHIDYAIQSYEVNAADYLLKPISQKRFNESILRMSQQLKINTPILEDRFILIRRSNAYPKVIKIKLSDLVAIEAVGRLTKIYFRDEFILSTSPFSAILNKVSSDADFIQVHRSFIILKNKIWGWDKTVLKMDNGMLVPIGRKYYDIFDEMEKDFQF